LCKKKEGCYPLGKIFGRNQIPMERRTHPISGYLWKATAHNVNRVLRERLAKEKILDSWALLCYLEQEPGFEKVVELFEKAVRLSEPLLMCMVNWGEVYYQVAKRFGEKKAREIEPLIESFPVSLVDADKNLTRETARIKATKPMAYADCSAVALARLKKLSFIRGIPNSKQLKKK